MPHSIVWLRHARQHLGLVPTLGGGVAAWQLDRPTGRVDLWRPWDGRTDDCYALASFPMLPWSNRISHGGFEHEGRFHPIALNRAGEPYPIHGDGWLQAWQCEQTAVDTLVMSLESHGHGGNPYHYRATQTFRLLDGGLDQATHVTNLGEHSLPFGIGLHPYFPRSARTRLTAPVQGVWLSGADPIPTAHTHEFPPTWNLSDGTTGEGSFIDNAYTGWAGTAEVQWPEQGLGLTLQVPALSGSGRRDGFCLLYRPPRSQGAFFCFEPVTHPIDAFHLAGRPGLATLGPRESLSLNVEWRVQELVQELAG